MKRRVACLTALVAAVAAGSTPARSADAGQGSGASILSVAPATVPVGAPTNVTVSGTDYLVPPHAPGVDVFGGVYVFFGWVSDPARFGPSIRNSSNNDGTFGVTYAYPGEGGDGSTRTEADSAIRFVSFTAGGESGLSTEYHMDDNGNWSTTVTLDTARFTSTNPSTGASTTYDCTVVQCGIFTIGAHGKSSATNERFFPITFAQPAAASTTTTSTTTTTTPAALATTTTAASAAAPRQSSTTVATASTAPGIAPPSSAKSAGTTPVSTAPATTPVSAPPSSEPIGPAGGPLAAPPVRSAGLPLPAGGDAIAVTSVETLDGPGPLAVLLGALVTAAVSAGVTVLLMRRRLARVTPPIAEANVAATPDSDPPAGGGAV